MLSIVSSFKNNFPGISEKAIEELFRAALNLHSNKCVNTFGDVNYKEPVKISRAYLAGLVYAFRMCGWMPEFEEHANSSPNGKGISVTYEKHYVEADDQVQRIEDIVEDWIHGER